MLYNEASQVIADSANLERLQSFIEGLLSNLDAYDASKPPTASTVPTLSDSERIDPVHTKETRTQLEEPAPEATTLNTHKNNLPVSSNNSRSYSSNGFWTGLWHGFLSPFRLFAKLFMTLDVWADNSTTGYGFGFVLGFIFLIGLGSES